MLPYTCPHTTTYVSACIYRYDDYEDDEFEAVDEAPAAGGQGSMAVKSPARLQYEAFLRQLTSKMQADKDDLHAARQVMRP
jgi:hypothetical protein